MTYFAKIGTTKIELPASYDGNVETARQLLQTSNPEIKHATIRQKTEGEHTIIEFLARPGRKG